MPRFMAQSTHGLDDPERATLPFIVANVAASADQDAIVLLTIEGVWLATKGYADDIHHPGMPPLSEVLASLLANYVQILLNESIPPRKRCPTFPPSMPLPCVSFAITRSR